VNTLPEEVVAAVDAVLEAQGLGVYDAALVVVRLPKDGGHRILQAHFGNPDVLRALIDEVRARLPTGVIFTEKPN